MTLTQELALRPCPFCRSRNIRAAGGGLFYAECKDCGAYGPSHDDSGPVRTWAQSANEKWNARSMREAPANVAQDVPGLGPVMTSGTGGARALPEPTGASLATQAEPPTSPEPYYKTHEPPHCPTCDCPNPWDTTSRGSEGEVKPVAWYDPNDFTRTADRKTAKEYAPLYAVPQPAQPSVEVREQVSEGSLLKALQETPGNNWLAQNMPDGSIQRIDELYRAFARRVMGRARQFDAENRAREISKGA